MADETSEHWYCVRAKTKREHIAASVLRSRTNLEVFCPRFTITKNTVRGPKPFTEALFPGYLFCRFDFDKNFRLVNSSQDVTGIVKFGNLTPTIPDSTMDQLISAVPQGTVEVKPTKLKEGDLVEIILGCFQGESGKVTKIEETHDRVGLLIEFLGNQVQIKLPSENLINRNPVHPGTTIGLQATSNY